MLGDMSYGPFHCLEPLNTEGFIKSEVGLIGTYKVRGGVYYLQIELQDIYIGHQVRVGVEPDAKQAVIASGGVQQFFDEVHYVPNASA